MVMMMMMMMMMTIIIIIITIISHVKLEMKGFLLLAINFQSWFGNLLCLGE